MQKPLVGRVLAAVLTSLLALAVPARAAAPKKSPFVEVLGRGTVVTAPRETTHKNRRKFLEFEITLSSASPTADQPAGADVHLALDTSKGGRVRVVHDLSCGGAAVALSVGDRIEIQGEYVHVPKGQDLIHFTHAADGKCGHGNGEAGRHPGGFLKKLPAASDAAPGSDRAGSALYGPAATRERASVFRDPRGEGKGRVQRGAAREGRRRAQAVLADDAGDPEAARGRRVGGRDRGDAARGTDAEARGRDAGAYAALTREGAAAMRAARRRFHQSAASHTVGITASA